MPNNVQTVLTADEQDFLRGTANAAMHAKQFENTLEGIRRGTIRVNAASRLYNFETGRLTKSHGLLQAAGIRTTGQVQQQIRVLEQLAVVARNDVVALQQIRSAQEQLTMTLKGTAQGSRHAEQALFSLGFIMDDSKQFALGFDQGMRAIGNNLQPLIMMLAMTQGGVKALAAAFMGPAGIIIGVSLLTTVLPLLIKHFSKTGESADDLKEKIGGITEVVRGLIRVQESLPPLAAITTDKIHQLAIAYGLEARAITDSVVALEARRKALTPSAKLPGQPTETRRAAQAEIRSIDQQLVQQRARMLEAVGTFDAFNASLREQIMLAKARLSLFMQGVPLENQSTSSLEEATEANKKLKEQLAQLKGPQGDRIRATIRENEALEKQIQLLVGTEGAVTILRDLQETYMKLRVSMAELGGPHAAEIGRLTVQNELLEEQVRVRTALARLSAMEQEFKVAFDTTELKRVAEELKNLARARGKQQGVRVDLEVNPNIDSLEKAWEVLQSSASSGVFIVKIPSKVDLELFDRTDFGDQVAKNQALINDMLRDLSTGARSEVVAANKQLDDVMFANADAVIQKHQEMASAVQDGLGSIAEATLSAAASGKNAGAALLGALGDVAIRVGKIALGTGIGIDAIRKSLLTLQGTPAIVAGLALIALGAAVKNAAAGAMSSGGGSGGGISQAGFSNANARAVDREPRRPVQPPTLTEAASRVVVRRTIPAVVRERPVVATERLISKAQPVMRVELFGKLSSERGSFDAEIRGGSFRNERLRTDR